MKKSEVWIIDGVRTPIGKHGGKLSGIRPDDLSSLVLKAVIERSGVDIKEIEDVYMGCANQAGEDNRNVARMGLLLAGLPDRIGGCTVNRLCGSGLEAVAEAARAVIAGEGHLFLAGGVESMSRSPLVIPKNSKPFQMGHVQAYDSTLGWRFINPIMEEMGHTDSLGVTAENLAEIYGISREEQDVYALQSQIRARTAMTSDILSSEIIPVKTGKDTVCIDEGPRPDTTIEKLSQLKPVFKKGGTVTAGNSSQISDGAAALIVASSEFAKAHGLKPMAKIRTTAISGCPPRIMGIGPVPATEKALSRLGLKLSDIDLIEINEAFAAQVLAVLREWKMDYQDPRLNVNGGAIPFGHPLGCSGAKLLTSMIHEMQRRSSVQFGLVTMCIGVGQGITMVIEKI